MKSTGRYHRPTYSSQKKTKNTRKKRNNVNYVERPEQEPMQKSEPYTEQEVVVNAEPEFVPEADPEPVANAEPEPEANEESEPEPEAKAKGELHYHYNNLVQFRAKDIGLGVCSRQKATILFQLIRQTPAPHFAVEIGVHLASSLVVMGAVVKGKGTCVGIDPYEPYVQKSLPKVQGRLNKVDQEWVHETACKTISTHDLDSTVKIVRETSEKYASKIKNHSVTFLHIDGNHDYDFVKQDIRLYKSKVMKDGVIVCNGYNFLDVRKAVEELLGNNKSFKQVTCSTNLPYLIAFKKIK